LLIEERNNKGKNGKGVKLAKALLQKKLKNCQVVYSLIPSQFKFMTNAFDSNAVATTSAVTDSSDTEGECTNINAKICI